ncbi:hypothetical protein D3C72_2290110 [compost metagenome]
MAGYLVELELLSIYMPELDLFAINVNFEGIDRLVNREVGQLHWIVKQAPVTQFSQGVLLYHFQVTVQV